MSVRLTYPIIFTIIVLLMSGCASPINYAPKLSDQTELKQGEGIVVARVINATGYSLPINSIYIAPKNLNASKEVKPILAEAEDKPIGDSALFAITLEPGEYSISSVYSFFYFGNGYYSRGTPADPEFGVFKVEAGSVTDLGTIIYYPKPVDDRYQDIIVRVPETGGGKLLKSYFPKFADKAQNVLDWDPDEREEERFLTYASIAQNPLKFSDIVPSPDGSVYFLGKLGVILRYTPEDGFEALAVETDLALNTFAASESGDRVVGGHEGALFFQKQNEEWQAIDIPEKSTVYHLSFYDNEHFDVIYSVYNQVFVKRFDTDDLSSVQTLNEYHTRQKWTESGIQISETQLLKNKQAKAQIVSSVRVLEKGGIDVVEIYLRKDGRWNMFDSGDKEEYSFQKDTWQINELPDIELEVDFILQAGAVDLGVKQPGFWSMTGRPTYFTRESENAPWTELNSKYEYCEEGWELRENSRCVLGKQAVKTKSDSFSFLSRPWFWDADNGLVVVSFTDVNFWSGARTSETVILRTENGGKQWTKTDLELPKKYCSNFIGEVKDRMLLSCDGATSDFYESNDQAKTWVHVRQQQDF